ncbi:hypothetical protein FNF29_01589 [Cafeteria roenbergensis]|uniref:Rhodanese domain-containing protein n=1 Tax=Cafeteria roenbergensis TaxID=33653 RepID=A0A5A8CTF4_CAFRO|nr:hypothetical protein FNF29_01589 [Cafeteria roenbergensis]KAA0171359.1 hypothetical protein FNF28_00850 [Cafeteria roenbergensis]|eukprot:KAA0155674.1 hypothetical protein FNF29_01589 [Cafeteria roenbergensis]
MAASAPGAQGRLSGEDVQRYSRQMLVPGFFGGAAGQLRLKQAHVLVVGCGGLGCPSAMCLAGAGVGTISLVDDDVVATSNLHRQLAHTSVGAERGQAKVDSLKDAMLRLNPTVDVRTLRARVNEHNALELVRGSTVVLDCTDNPATRYLVGDACALAGVPLVSAAALGCDGQLSLHGYRDGPCYRCLHPSPPPRGTVGSCDESGVLGPVTSTMGSLQAMEALKVVAGADPASTLSGKLLSVDAADARFRVVKLRGRRPECPACGASGGAGAWTMAKTGEQLRSLGVLAEEGTTACAPCEAAAASTTTAAAATAAAAVDSATSGGSGSGATARWCASLPLEAAAEVLRPLSAGAGGVAGAVATLAYMPAGGAAEAVAGGEARTVDLPGPAASGEGSKALRAVVLDVRSTMQRAICRLPGSLHTPLAGFPPASSDGGAAPAPPSLLEAMSRLGAGAVVCVCRRGVDSLTAAKRLRAAGLVAVSAAGGLNGFKAHCDAGFPAY